MATLKAFFVTVMLLAATVIPATATTIYTLSATNLDITKVGPGPYAQVTVTMQDADTAMIQVDALNGFLFGEVGLNVLGGDATARDFSTTPALGAGNYYFDTGSKNLDGFGFFNETVTPHSDGFANALSQLIFSLDNLSSTVWASDAMVLSENGSGTGYVAAAHIFDGANTLTGFAAATPVPEPGTVMLLCAGLLGVVVYGKSRKASSGSIMA